MTGTLHKDFFGISLDIPLHNSIGKYVESMWKTMVGSKWFTLRMIYDLIASNSAAFDEVGIGGMT